MTFELTVLGSGSGAPTPSRYNSAQVLNVHGRFVLIDCGEGTQFQLRRNSINFNRIELILISHLHGDHFYGLAGLLNTMHLLGRTKEIHIVGHQKLETFINLVFDVSSFKAAYPIHFHLIPDNYCGNIIEMPKYSVKVFPLIHRIISSGFLITEKEAEHKIKKTFIRKYNPSISEIKDIKKGKDYIDEKAKVIPNSEILIPAPKPRSFAYASDTAYFPDIIPNIKEADLLYHEATFDESKYKNAKEKFHSTAKDAAMIAKAANVKKLLIGHFSARYNDVDILLKEAQNEFPNTITAFDGLKILI